MGNGYYTPRLSIEVTQQQLDRLRKLFPHGTMRPTVIAMLEDLMDLMEKHGAGTVVGLALDRKLRVANLTTFKGIETNANAEQHQAKPEHVDGGGSSGGSTTNSP